MGLPPTKGDENQPAVAPAEAGVHVRPQNLDSRLRGNDIDRVLFDRAYRRDAPARDQLLDFVEAEA